MVNALREIHRVLRPGGSQLVVNEPLRWPTDLKRDHGAEVLHFAGNKHVYFLPEYIWLARRAGFRCIQPRDPTPNLFHLHDPIHLTVEAGVLGSWKLATVNIVRQRALLRCLYIWWRYLLGPDVSLQMTCTKSAA